MDLSMKWLNEFVQLDVTTRDFCDAMTLSGSKVESARDEGDKLDNIVVGHVLNVEKHPNADKLVVCTIDVGLSENVHIVTAATNVNKDDYVPVAMDGSTLVDGTKIKKGKLRGVESQGMLCSVGEIGVTTDDFPCAVDDGIFIIHGQCTPGEDIREAIGFNDTVVEFEITPNRPDCLSVIGLAREVAATFDKQLTVPTPVIKSRYKATSDIVKIQYRDETLCPAYSLGVVTGIKVGPSPRWMRARLRAMGVKPINNVIDITNYVMLEYGQPMHVYDVRNLRGAQLSVRCAKEGERLVLLDGGEIKLSEKDLVIVDADGPVGLAGIMGGKNSGVKSDTTMVVFESANFKSSAIRFSSRKHSIRTEASGRFEKGLDVHGCTIALKRALQLAESLHTGCEVEAILSSGNPVYKQREIDFDSQWINALLGTSISSEFMVNVLERVGCCVKGNRVSVPSYRPDIQGKYDIAEEIARFYGYNKIKSIPMKMSCDGIHTEYRKMIKTLCDVMLSEGIDEAMTYSFIGEQDYSKTMVDGLNDCVRIKNPLGETTSIMRNTVFPSMMESLAVNYKNKNESVKLFEVAREYYVTDDVCTPFLEKEKLVVGMYGDGTDFFDLKGVFEELAKVVGLFPYKVVTAREGGLHPHRCANVLVNDQLVCTMGEVHPLVSQNYKINQRVYYMTVDIEGLFVNSNPDRKYTPLAKYPAVERDLCLVCDEDVPASILEETIRVTAGKLLGKLSLFDLYRGDQIPKGKKSIAFNVYLQSEDGTLTDERVNRTIKKIVQALQKINVNLRDETKGGDLNGSHDGIFTE